MDDTELDQWDPVVTRQAESWAAAIAKWWYRSEVYGLENIPDAGGVLVVANHSGGMLTPDVLVFGPAFYRHFGYDRPLYTLAHYGVLLGPTGALFRRLGVIHASRENAAAALHSGAAVLVFPGGDYDAYRPTFEANRIDFDGRTGYVRTALAADVPIVPTVSIGAQESQLFLTRGNWLAKRLGLPRFRLDILPVSIGLPFGPSVIVPPNLPLPTKIVTEVLPPIDITARFGPDPDIGDVDAHIRGVMQTALDRLAAQRRFPVLG
ncbi:acyltransferase family protein [Mycobacterium sp. TNTM28]|uniref:Acyltransferase family protein n=1 Tax=[Mycobacterium] fortunisiensis TaxID=2600579 RepID=A0ABS6KP14_9MYCO|nr:lysophospholipid acyltransferase family protein [[Mycobacterium] fortunisiensis]MBU9765244.1 acyltransferase family protein [[Mycobacterium] fortunisiensis]